MQRFECYNRLKLLPGGLGELKVCIHSGLKKTLETDFLFGKVYCMKISTSLDFFKQKFAIVIETWQHLMVNFNAFSTPVTHVKGSQELFFFYIIVKPKLV